MTGTVLFNIAVALIALGFVIVVHEAGHFFVAKLFRIRVETFSVGFGPRLFGYRYGDTDYRISALPLGGYVKMAGENPGEETTGSPHDFMSKPKWQRFLVAFAGPVMNGVLAVALLAGLYMYGSEVPEYLDDQALVGIVEPDSPAAVAGVQVGDLIVELDGEMNPTWQRVDTKVALSPERPLPLVLTRDGQTIETTLTPGRTQREELGYSGMAPRERILVGAFTHENSPGAQAGLLYGDEIVAVGDVNLQTSSRTIQEILQTYPSDVVPLTVQRGEETLYLNVEPQLNEEGRRVIGFFFLTPTEMIKLGFVDAVDRSIRTNATNAMLIFEVLGKLITREASMRSIEGPIGIVNVSGQAFQAGMSTLIYLMAIISLNLGLINLLPIPILDGGVMLLLAVEGVMGQDLSMAVKERIVQVSFVFLLTLMVFVIYNDVVKLMPTAP